MSVLSVAEAKSQFSEVLRRVQHGGERILVARHGKPVAAIVSTDLLDALEALEDAIDVREAAKAVREANRKGSISLDELRRRLAGSAG